MAADKPRPLLQNSLLVSTLEGAIKEVWGYKVALFADKCSPCYKLEKKMS